MNPLTVGAIILLAVLIVVAATGYAWWDYRTRPERYGYRPGERGKTREEVHDWSPPRGQARAPASRPLNTSQRTPFRWRT
jgi:hypothetical protein